MLLTSFFGYNILLQEVADVATDKSAAGDAKDTKK
jgi:hypothetical protein